eukprot:gene4505-6729_t
MFRDKVIVKDFRQDKLFPSLESILTSIGVDSNGSLNIDNKYYRATINFISEQNDSTLQLELREDHGVDAAILVVDAFESNSVSAVKQCLSTLAAAGVSVLIVADACPENPSSNYSLDLYHIFASSLVINLSYTKSCTEEIRRACVDHRAEYTQLGNTFAQGVNLYNDGDENEVKTNVESMSVDAHQPSTGGQISIFQESDGTKRIREALEAHLWEHLEMKTNFSSLSTSSQPLQRKKLSSDVSLNSDYIHLTADDNIIRGEHLKNDPRECAIERDEGREDELLNSLLQNISTIGDERLSDDLEADDDEGFDLMNLVSQMQSIRAEGTSLPDEQRRIRAAAVAMALSQLLGEDDIEDNNVELPQADK